MIMQEQRHKSSPNSSLITTTNNNNNNNNINNNNNSIRSTDFTIKAIMGRSNSDQINAGASPQPGSTAESTSSLKTKGKNRCINYILGIHYFINVIEMLLKCY